MARLLVFGMVALVALMGCAQEFHATRTEPTPLVGVASVVDGDTLEVHGERVRLYGIDAFESGQRCVSAAGSTVRCGAEAARRLDMLVQGQSVTCKPMDTDRYGRTVARCSTALVADLGEALVEAGWAIAYKRYSHDYVGAESLARDNRRGAWRGKFQTPSDWRADRREGVRS